MAAVIVLSIIMFGVVAVLVASRPPRSVPSRVLATIVVLPACAAGMWLALLEVGTGARGIGAAAAVAGVFALARIWRRA